MGLTASRVEKAYETHAWILLFVYAILGAIRAVVWVWTGLLSAERFQSAGLSFDESMGYTYFGIWQFLLCITAAVIAAIPFRMGVRWAWYVSWAIPAAGIGEVLANLYAGASVSSQAPSLLFPAIPVVGLLLPYWKFFPSRAATPS